MGDGNLGRIRVGEGDLDRVTGKGFSGMVYRW